jgi:hypothetical protein
MRYPLSACDLYGNWAKAKSKKAVAAVTALQKRCAQDPTMARLEWVGAGSADVDALWPPPRHYIGK